MRFDICGPLGARPVLRHGRRLAGHVEHPPRSPAHVVRRRRALRHPRGPDPPRLGYRIQPLQVLGSPNETAAFQKDPTEGLQPRFLGFPSPSRSGSGRRSECWRPLSRALGAGARLPRGRGPRARAASQSRSRPALRRSRGSTRACARVRRQAHDRSRRRARAHARRRRRRAHGRPRRQARDPRHRHRRARLDGRAPAIAARGRHRRRASDVSLAERGGEPRYGRRRNAADRQGVRAAHPVDSRRAARPGVRLSMPRVHLRTRRFADARRRAASRRRGRRRRRQPPRRARQGRRRRRSRPGRPSLAAGGPRRARDADAHLALPSPAGHALGLHVIVAARSRRSPCRQTPPSTVARSTRRSTSPRSHPSRHDLSGPPGPWSCPAPLHAEAHGALPRLMVRAHASREPRRWTSPARSRSCRACRPRFTSTPGGSTRARCAGFVAAARTWRPRAT